MKKCKAYLIHNLQEFKAVNKLIDYYYGDNFFDFPNYIIIIIYTESYCSDQPGWDYYENVKNTTRLDKYIIIDAKYLIRKEKLLQLKSYLKYSVAGTHL